MLVFVVEEEGGEEKAVLGLRVVLNVAREHRNFPVGREIPF